MEDKREGALSCSQHPTERNGSGALKLGWAGWAGKPSLLPPAFALRTLDALRMSDSNLMVESGPLTGSEMFHTGSARGAAFSQARL